MEALGFTFVESQDTEAPELKRQEAAPLSRSLEGRKGRKCPVLVPLTLTQASRIWGLLLKESQKEGVPVPPLKNHRSTFLGLVPEKFRSECPVVSWGLMAPSSAERGSACEEG